VFAWFADMIQAGSFPYPSVDEPLPDSPRVGDGVLVADASGIVSYASPNATSALTRAGVVGNLIGRPLSELKVGHSLVAEAMSGGRAVSGEVEPAPEMVLSIRILPLFESSAPAADAPPGGEVREGTSAVATSGLVLLLRDVTDLRRRDRLLLSKDATIREIHHRVKNNLQTISSLLRLQGRRLAEPTAKAAVEESARRIRSIAVVHEMLSREAGDDVDFGEVVRPLVHMVEEGLVSDDRPVHFHLSGEAATMASPVATALAVVLTDLLQNVVEHAAPRPAEDGTSTDGRGVEVQLELGGTTSELVLTVADDGRGLPGSFDPATTTSLGLSIVHSLVTSELGGSITFDRAADDPMRPGTKVVLRVPLVATSHPARRT
jgi:two-component sensor histidine kinase